MATTDRSATSPRRSADPDEASELGRAAADLEALTDAYDACQWSLESLEAAFDALLDDPSTCALVLDEHRHVLAVSRGMSSVLEVEGPIIGAGTAGLLPPGWPDLHSVLARLAHDEGWRSLPAGEGTTVLVRRATEDDRTAVYVVRYQPAGG